MIILNKNEFDSSKKPFFNFETSIHPNPINFQQTQSKNNSSQNSQKLSQVKANNQTKNQIAKKNQNVKILASKSLFNIKISKILM